MNRLNNSIFILGYLIISASCSQADLVKFQKPQPSFEDQLPAFGKRIQGIYESLTNLGDSLLINDYSIILHGIYSDSCTRDQVPVDSMVQININKDSEIIKYLSTNGCKVKIIKDSVFYYKAYQDTIFKINAGQVLKKFRGDYYLNYLLNDGYWNMKIMYIKHDTLYFDEINPTTTLDEYNYVSKNEIGTVDSIKRVEYILDPDKKEFKRLLNSGMIDHTEKYIRIRMKSK